MKASEILKLARERIANPENWTQGYFARDAQDREVDLKSPKACSFCSIGAVKAASPENLDPEIESEACQALRQTIAAEFVIPSSVVAFNDAHYRKHEDVLRLFDATIERLENENR